MPAKSILMGTAALVAAAVSAVAQTDNFSGGDGAWTRYSPLTPFGAGGTFTTSSDSYRIQAPASPNPAALGPARAGSYRGDFSYNDFTVSVDVKAWDPADNQAIGVLGRLSNVGLGQTDGYLFAFFPQSGSMAINRLDNENASALAGSLAPVNSSKQYRLVFSGVGSTLTGTIYDLSNLSTPLATTSISDSKYTSGFSGLFVSAALPAGIGSAADATFGSYSATAAPEPSTWALLGFGFAGLAAAAARRRA